GIYLYVTKTYHEILGYEREDIINKVPIFSLIHPDDFMSIYNIYTKSFISKTSNFAFLRFRKKDGSYCIVESFGSPIYNEKKEIEKVVYLSYVLKEEHPSISQTESKFLTNNFLNLVPYPFLIIQSKKIIFLNEVAENLLGWDSFEIAGKDYSTILNNRNDLKNFIEKPTYSQEGKFNSPENIIFFKKKNNELFPALANVVPTNPEFDNEAYIIFINELSAGKKEIQPVAQNQEPDHDTLKDIILDNLSYELRTPLNGIIGAAQYLKTYILTKEDRKFAELITESSTKLLKTLSSIIDLSELEAGTKSVSPTSINLIELINSSISNFAKDAEFKDISLSFETDLTEAIVQHDPLIISNILNPLIDNAIKFTKYGEVVVSLAKSSRINDNYKYIIKVRDTGIGIEEQEYNSIFDAFKKSRISSDKKIPGLGLGLAVVKKYSDLGKIDIDFNSQRGFGTTFSIYISDYKED
ncbi:MAG TPA: ATP-binding protein, partial [Bacteroidota bacterium]|nr:ATP-binding protein [Bacteroidota bacterium]